MTHSHADDKHGGEYIYRPLAKANGVWAEALHAGKSDDDDKAILTGSEVVTVTLA